MRIYMKSITAYYEAGIPVLQIECENAQVIEVIPPTIGAVVEAIDPAPVKAWPLLSIHGLRDRIEACN